MTPVARGGLRFAQPALSGRPADCRATLAPGASPLHRRDPDRLPDNDFHYVTTPRPSAAADGSCEQLIARTPQPAGCLPALGSPNSAVLRPRCQPPGPAALGVALSRKARSPRNPVSRRAFVDLRALDPNFRCRGVREFLFKQGKRSAMVRPRATESATLDSASLSTFSAWPYGCYRPRVRGARRARHPPCGPRARALRRRPTGRPGCAPPTRRRRPTHPGCRGRLRWLPAPPRWSRWRRRPG